MQKDLLTDFSKSYAETQERLKLCEARLAKIENFLEKLFKENFFTQDVETDFTQKNLSYTKSTSKMIDSCYTYGKKAFENQVTNVRDYANAVEEETGMNRSSAIIYIYVVKNMLEGEVFKRAVSLKSIREYFEKIRQDFGESVLKKAISATRKHAEYRKQFGHPVDSIVKICDEYEKR